MLIDINKITQEQFDHVLNLLIVYKQANRKKTVYLNEKSLKESIIFMNTYGKDMANQLGMRQ